MASCLTGRAVCRGPWGRGSAPRCVQRSWFRAAQVVGSCRVPRPCRLRSWFRGGRRGGKTMIPRRPRSLRLPEPMRSWRGSCRATRVAPRLGSRPAEVMSSVVLLLEEAVPTEVSRLCRYENSVPGCATRSRSRPPWCLQAPWRDSRGWLGSYRVKKKLRCARAPEALDEVVARGRVACSSLSGATSDWGAWTVEEPGCRGEVMGLWSFRWWRRSLAALPR